MIDVHITVQLIPGFGDKSKVSETDLEIARILLDAGSEVDYVSLGTAQIAYQSRGSALTLAVERNALPFVELLLDAGANPDFNCKSFQNYFQTLQPFAVSESTAGKIST